MMIQKWVENECKADASLSLVATLYKNLLADGYSFSSSEPKKTNIARDIAAVSIREGFFAECSALSHYVLFSGGRGCFSESYSAITSRGGQGSEDQQALSVLKHVTFRIHQWNE